MKKITIVIPNYNNAKFIEECMNSVVRQKYQNKEIIVVDDGSTDGSTDIIRRVINKNEQLDIRLFCQNNLNAAMARNNGMHNATGDYILFLDSDDVLEEDALSKLISIYESNDTDLVIGNYGIIAEDGNLIGEKKFGDEMVTLDLDKDFRKILHMNPVPSNKLYDLKMIRTNNLEWGNVRIAQDLNFYFKYLLLCKRVTVVPHTIYKYRMTNNSISRTFDFRIFDIVNSFDDIERFYKQQNAEILYDQYMPPLILEHYDYQLSKQIFYDHVKTRRMIVDYFNMNEKKIDYSTCIDGDISLKRLRDRYRLKCILKYFYTSEIYRRRKIGERK